MRTIESETNAKAEKRLQQFLDCVARLLAKRSLREPQNQEQDENEHVDGATPVIDPMGQPAPPF